MVSGLLGKRTSRESSRVGEFARRRRRERPVNYRGSIGVLPATDEANGDGQDEDPDDRKAWGSHRDLPEITGVEI
jgi:hypothetical protein